MYRLVPLLSQILGFSSSEIKDVIDSGFTAQELIFADETYLQEYFGFDKQLISKVKALRQLFKEMAFEELQKDIVIRGVNGVIKYLKTILRTLTVEHFVVLFLNKGCKIVDHLECYGSNDHVRVDYRLIIKRALVSEAAKVICVHNHPGGSASPSCADRDVTKELKALFSKLNIELLDHIIIAKRSYYSFIYKRHFKY